MPTWERTVSPELELESARWLVSDDGRAAVANVTAALDEGRDELVIATRLRREGVAAQHAAAAITAGVARRRARASWPDADELLFTRESLEQASHPTVAAWRARRFTGMDVWDLCAGVGGDALALAERARHLVAVELSPARATLLTHNASVRRLPVEVIVGDALDVDVPSSGVMHADPARRRDGRRVKWLKDHLPAVPALVERHQAAAGRAIVASPAVDLGDPDLPADLEVEFLQLGDRLVESVLWSGSLRPAGVSATATLLPSGDQRSRGSARPARLAVGAIGTQLVEVAAAAIRARLHDDVGGEIGARRVSAHRALLTTDDRPAPSPWYRARRVVTVQPARPKALRAWLQRADPGPIEIVLHGVDGDPERWWRELGRPPRGPTGVRIELVRLDRGAQAIVTVA